MTQFVTKEALQKMATLQKGYIDSKVATKQDKFTCGNGLAMVDNVLSITLDTSLYKIVTELPTAPTEAESNKIFLVLSAENETGNTYVEYIYLGAEKGWEKVGEFKAAIDLTPYLKIEDLTAATSATGFSVSKGTTKILDVAFATADFAGTAGEGTYSLALANVVTAAAKGFYKVQVDAKGRVIATEAVAASDITGLGFSDTNAMAQAIATAVSGEKTLREQADQRLDERLQEVEGKVETLEEAESNRSILSETEAQEMYEAIYNPTTAE